MIKLIPSLDKQEISDLIDKKIEERNEFSPEENIILTCGFYFSIIVIILSCIL